MVVPFEIAEKIIARASEYGIDKKDIIVDPLAMAVSSDSNSANITLEAVKILNEKGIKTYMWADKLHKIVDKRGEAHGASEKLVYAIPTEGNVKALEVMGKTYPLYDIHWFEAPDYVKEKGFCHCRSLFFCS